MSFVAKFTFKRSDAALQNCITYLPDATFRIPYSVPVGGNEVSFVIVIHDDEWAKCDAALEADDTIADWERLFTTPTYAVYKTKWLMKYMNIWSMTARLGVFIERIWAQDGVWTARVHLDSRKTLKTLREWVTGQGFNVEVEGLQTFEYTSSRQNLTDSQMGLLKDAYEHGYFQVPRGIRQAELAERHEVSESAVSQQIRRALNNLLREYFEYGGQTTDPLDNRFFREFQQDSQ